MCKCIYPTENIMCSTLIHIYYYMYAEPLEPLENFNSVQDTGLTLQTNPQVESQFVPIPSGI